MMLTMEGQTQGGDVRGDGNFFVLNNAALYQTMVRLLCHSQTWEQGIDFILEPSF